MSQTTSRRPLGHLPELVFGPPCPRRPCAPPCSLSPQVLESGLVDPGRYTYVMLLNSSVRGPFLPAHWPQGLHWTRALTARLSGDVRMAGATISCEPAWEGGLLSGRQRQNPHVQSYLVAMDQASGRQRLPGSSWCAVTALIGGCWAPLLGQHGLD